MLKIDKLKLTDNFMIKEGGNIDQELFNQNQEQKWKGEDETVQTAKENIKKILNNAFTKKSPLTNEQIEDIKKELYNLKGLVTNFDETFIKEKTFMNVLEILISQPESFNNEDIDYQKFCNNTVYFRKFIANLRGKDKYKDFDNQEHNFTDQDKEELQKDENKTAVQIFYEKCLGGLSKELIEEKTSQIAKEQTLNENILKVFAEIKKARLEVKNIPLLVLTRNNDLIIKYFLEANKDILEKNNIITLGIAANQITFRDNKVAGVVEHITKDNKNEFIADSSILLVDDDETLENLEKKVNAVNVQEGSFDINHVEEAIEVSEEMEWGNFLEIKINSLYKIIDDAEILSDKDYKKLISEVEYYKKIKQRVKEKINLLLQNRINQENKRRNKL